MPCESGFSLAEMDIFTLFLTLTFFWIANCFYVFPPIFWHYISLLSVVSIDPAGRSGQQEFQDPADAIHVGRRFQRDREAPDRSRVARDQSLAGDDGPDSLR